MIKKLSTLIFVALALVSASVPARAQMTDGAVIEYIKKGMASGKSQSDMAKELAMRGVTKEQAERIKAKYDREQTSQAGAVKTAGAQEYQRRLNDNQLENSANDISILSTELNDSSEVRVYGRGIFKSKNLTFAPSANLPTPVNYVLGPGDEVIIDIWGTNQANIRETISQDGTINIPDIGIINLNGMTISKADAYLKRKLGQIYSVDGDDAKSEIKLSLGNIRTIQVNLMGEVANPGTYYLSSLSNLYHALHSAGGVGPLGSLRNIQLIRKGKKIATIDIYEFIRDGKMDGDLILEEGDIVNVPPYEIIVDIAGSVKRPMAYELKKGETVADLIEYAAGFKGDAYKKNIRMIRKNGLENMVFTIDDAKYSTFELMDGDNITVGMMLDRFANRIEIKGAVYRPGIYQLGDGVSTVSELIAKADGLKGDAFTNRALIHREREDLTLEVVQVDVRSIMNGTGEDVKLVKNDVIYIPSIHDLKDLGHIIVEGEVARPDTLVFAENTTLEDAIMQVGGLLESASTVKIDVSRRIKDASSLLHSDKIAEVFTFTFKNGYILDGEPGFVLQPYDYVFVRKSPSYAEQSTVDIQGEVTFPGSYTIANRAMRLSDLVAQAGGLSQWAYINGARLSREVTSEEYIRMRTVLDVTKSAKDSIDTKQLNLRDRYFVGIDLAAALAKPGCEADLVLREGDILSIPQYANIVRITGNVLYPNTVTYSPDMTVKDYIDMAGGYGFRAKKNRTYIVYMNGMVSRARKFSKSVVTPGCEIVVPKRREKEGGIQEILSIATTATSLATMIATIGNLVL